MTNLDHLNVVAAICDTGSFQSASEKLNKARSAVSYSVKQVEDFYQVELFDRTNYRPKLTHEGKVVLGRIRKLLKQADSFEDFMRELKGDVETEIRLGVSSNFPIARLSELLRTLRHEFPATVVHLNIETASGEQLLLAQKVDIAIFAVPSRSPFVDYKQIDYMSFPLVISRDLLSADPAAVTETDLAQHQQIIVRSGDQKSANFGIVDEAPKWYVTDLHTKKDLICAGLGWGRLPSHFVENDIDKENLVQLSTLGDLSLPICLTKLAENNLGPVGKRIWDFYST